MTYANQHTEPRWRTPGQYRTSVQESHPAHRYSTILKCQVGWMIPYIYAIIIAAMLLSVIDTLI
jgi:hypothetical protein